MFRVLKNGGKLFHYVGSVGKGKGRRIDIEDFPGEGIDALLPLLQLDLRLFRKIVEEIKKDYPGVKIVVETAMYVDPKHSISKTPNEGTKAVFEVPCCTAVKLNVAEVTSRGVE
jgi:hypothetical protein